MGRKANVAVERAKVRVVGVMVVGWGGLGGVFVAGWEISVDIGDSCSKRM